MSWDSRLCSPVVLLCLLWFGAHPVLAAGVFWVSDVHPCPACHLAKNSTRGKSGNSPVTSAAKYLKMLQFLSASSYLCSPSRVSSPCSVLIKQTERCRALPLSHRPPSFYGESLFQVTDHVKLDVCISGKTLINLRTGVPPKTSPPLHSSPQIPVD